MKHEPHSYVGYNPQQLGRNQRAGFGWANGMRWPAFRPVTYGMTPGYFNHDKGNKPLMFQRWYKRPTRACQLWWRMHPEQNSEVNK